MACVQAEMINWYEKHGSVFLHCHTEPANNPGLIGIFPIFVLANLKILEALWVVEYHQVCKGFFGKLIISPNTI